MWSRGQAKPVPNEYGLNGRPLLSFGLVVAANNKIFLSGFGTFSVSKRKTRKGRNPKTGEAIKIAARVIPKFKAAKAFKEAVK